MILYITNDADNVINKTLLTPISIPLNLRREIDAIMPKIIVECDDDILSHNYCSIVSLGRHYFIDNISNLGGKRWELSLRCDVLETYKDDILNSSARYKRGVKTGDSGELNLQFSADATITKYSSNVEPELQDSIIMATVGE